MNKDLRKAMVGILEDLSADPTQVWIHSHGGGATHFTTGLVLNRAWHLSSFQECQVFHQSPLRVL